MKAETLFRLMAHDWLFFGRMGGLRSSLVEKL
jgi:hypothetical protein